jgi:hypothetical protein
MSKKIVMKSVAAVAVLGIVLLFSSCQKDEKKIIGTWKCEKTEIKDLSSSDVFMGIWLKTMLQQYLGSGIVFINEVEFTKEGKIMAHTMLGERIGTYKVNDSKLTITSSGFFDGTHGISFPDKKTLQWDLVANDELLIYLSEMVSIIFEEEIDITR